MSHIGIRLRISLPDGSPLLDANSDALHAIAQLGWIDPCDPSCAPGCGKHGWHSLIPGPPDMGFLGPAGLLVDIKPVMLPDPVTDDELDEEMADRVHQAREIVDDLCDIKREQP